MGLIKEPLDVVFYDQSKLLTQKEKELISEHIREYKEKITNQKRKCIVTNCELQSHIF